MTWIFSTSLCIIVVSLLLVSTVEDLTGSLEEDDFRQYLDKDSGQCTDNPPISCRDPKPYYDDPGIPPLNSKAPSNVSTSDLTNTTHINTSDSISNNNDQETTLVPLHSTGQSHSALSKSSGLGSGAVETSTEMGQDGSGGSGISIAAVAFIVIGAIFFIVLVILIIILCICLCPRKSTRKTFVPAPPPQSGSKSIVT